jgi:hypothetical protein
MFPTSQFGLSGRELTYACWLPAHRSKKPPTLWLRPLPTGCFQNSDLRRPLVEFGASPPGWG